MAEAEDKVMVAVDNSEQAEHALKFYLEYTHRPATNLILVHVMELPYVPFEIRQEVAQDLLDKAKVQGQAVEDKFDKLLKDKGVNYRILCEFGAVGEVLVSLAGKEGVRLVVVGCRGMGSIRRTILGSVSDYVVHHAHCPVMICRD